MRDSFLRNVHSRNPRMDWPNQTRPVLQRVAWGHRQAEGGTRRWGRIGLWTNRGQAEAREVTGLARHCLDGNPLRHREEFSHLSLLLSSLYSASLSLHYFPLMIKPGFGRFYAKFLPVFGLSLDFPHGFCPPLNFQLPRSISPHATNATHVWRPPKPPRRLDDAFGRPGGRLTPCTWGRHNRHPGEARGAPTTPSQGKKFRTVNPVYRKFYRYRLCPRNEFRRNFEFFGFKIQKKS